MDWNKRVYRNIFKRKRKLITELKRVQCILELRVSKKLRKRELELQQEINEVLKHEKILWFQKSRAMWLVNADRNTKYFHSRKQLN